MQNTQSTQSATLVIVSSSAKSRNTQVVTPIDPAILSELAAHKLNTCNQIKSLYATGFSQKQIVASGYNASTVYRQCKEYADSQAVVPTV